MSSKSNKRKSTVEKSGQQRPSVFERLGTKAEQSASNSSGFCRHWNNTGNCPFGSTCKNAMHHTLISPSKQRAASKDKEHRPTKPRSSSGSRNSLSRLHSTIIPAKGSGTPPQAAVAAPGEAGGPWEEEWNERSLEHADEKELERRRQQLQRELELQMKKEIRKQKLSATASSSATKKGSRSSSSSSSSSSGSSSSSSGSSSRSSSSRGHASKARSSSSKQRGRRAKKDHTKPPSKSTDGKGSRNEPKDAPKKRIVSSGNARSGSRSRQHLPPASNQGKRRRASSSPDSSGSERRKQGRGNSGQHQSNVSRPRGRSPSPDRKLDRKRPAFSHDKLNKRRDVTPPPRKSSLPPAKGPVSRKRSASPLPRSRRRSPSPVAARSRSGKRQGSNSRNTSPVPARRRSPSLDRKDTSRRGHTPQSPPADRGYSQRGGRGSHRSSPEPAHRNPPSRDNRPRPQPARDSRQSPDRRPLPPRASSREPADNKRSDWGRGRDYPANSPPLRGHHRLSPDSSNGSTSRGGNRDFRAGDKPRSKDHDRDRDRRRDVPLSGDKGRDKVRGRNDEGELPSLLTLMTQHPGHFSSQQSSSRPRPLPRDEPPLEHRSSSVRDRGRFERYESDRGGDAYSDQDDHHRSSGGSKRAPPSRREPSPPPPRPQRPQKSQRDWPDYPESRGRDWDRRPGPKGPGGNASSAPLRQWGPVPGSEEQPRQNRMLPPLSVRNAMQAARRGGASSPSNSQPSAAPGSPQTAAAEIPQKASSESKPVENSPDEVEPSQKDTEQEKETPKEVAVKRPREVISEGEDEEPVAKRQCVEDTSEAVPTPAPQPVVVAPLDLMESDLSDISDDADDILNAEGAEEPEELEMDEKTEAAAACEEEEEEEPVDDILDTMDFEEISDGELEAEESRGGVDALTVDWAALLSQTRSREGEETREARTHRWQSSQLLARLGVSMALCGPELANKLGIKVNGATEENNTTEPRVELLDPVAGIHVALRARKQQRESIFQLRDRRGLSAADDLAFRRQLNGLPAKKPGHQFNPTAEPDLYRQAVDMFLAK